MERGQAVGGDRSGHSHMVAEASVGSGSRAPAASVQLGNLLVAKAYPAWKGQALPPPMVAQLGF